MVGFKKRDRVAGRLPFGLSGQGRTGYVAPLHSGCGHNGCRLRLLEVASRGAVRGGSDAVFSMKWRKSLKFFWEALMLDRQN
jgi:hypothetical protein